MTDAPTNRRIEDVYKLIDQLARPTLNLRNARGLLNTRQLSEAQYQGAWKRLEIASAEIHQIAIRYASHPHETE